MLTPEQIMRHSDPNPGEDPWVDGPPATEEIVVVAYDPAWPATYRTLAEEIRATLGDAVLALDHVGSTSVPGLAAKPIIDIDLTVASTSDEDIYVPALERLGYRLTIREPSFHGHRCLQRSEPASTSTSGPPTAPRSRCTRSSATGSASIRTSVSGTRRRKRRRPTGRTATCGSTTC